MNVLLVWGVLLGWMSCAVAHMSMQFPYPRDTLAGADYAAWKQNEPMWSVRPTVCHGLDEDSSIRSGNAFAAGDTIDIDLYGSVPHNGGHCSFWWSTDTSGDWHKIIDIVDCTLSDSFSVMLPYTMSTECQSKCAFAWSWSPFSSGLCEIYMNCADISVSGVTGISSTDTDITVSFQDIIDTEGCERVDESTHYTPVFNSVKTAYTDDDRNAGTEVTVDTVDIVETIEDDTDALCENLNADNVNGNINNDGRCGNLCDAGDSCRCETGECCSANGYCGPEIAYYDETAGEYVYYHYGNGVSYYDDASDAISDYCDNNQGDWRLVSCSSSDAAGTGGTASLRDAAKMPEGTDATTTNGAIQVGHVMIGALLMQVVCLFVAFLG